MCTTNFFDVNIKILKGSGIYPPQTASKLRNVFIWLFNGFCVFYSIIFFTVAQLASLEQSSSNINDLVKNLNMSMSFILTFFKAAIWCWHYKELSAIMAILQLTSTQFVKIDDVDPQDVIKADRRLKDGVTFTFFTLSFLVPTSSCLLALVDVFSATAHAQQLRDWKLPYHSYVPFDYSSSMFGYSVAVVYQCLALLLCGMITVGLDMLFFSIVCFTSTHFNLLQGAFATIKEKAGISAHPGSLQERMLQELRACIQHLQLVLQICDQLERIFNLLILLQILISLIVFCTCLYIISSIPIGSNIPGNEILYMLAIENQLALYCYAGNKLTVAAAEILNSVYNSDWIITTDIKYRRNIIFTMMRMSKPIYLTAAKFTTITLGTFIAIGRGSYSLFAMLKSRQ